MTDVDIAWQAATAASRIIQTHHGTVHRRTAKDGADFATEVDVAAEEAIVAVIRAACPGDAVQGEESGLSGPADATRLWLVDPLCGTLNYAAGGAEYAVNIACTAGDAVLAAVVAEPATGVAYLTDGVSAWRRDAAGRDVPIRPSPISRIVEVHLETADPDEQGFSSARYLRSRTFESLTPRYLGTALPLAWVASGRRAGFVIPGQRGPSVHFTAGIGLCRAAGCVLTDLRGHPLHLANQGIVAAADAATHAVLLQGIADQMTVEQCG